jgi:hypothetical protein
MKRTLYFLTLLSCMLVTVADGQVNAAKDKNHKPKPKAKERQLVQFSGEVVTSDSLRPIPNTSIFARNTYHGTMSDFFGYFSFVAQAGDTVEFSSIGFKPHSYVIPDTLKASKYSLLLMLRRDTVMLTDVVIYPWPTKEQFVQAFIRNPIPGDDIDRARNNLSASQMTARAESMPNDASMNYLTSMQQQYSRLYYAGQLPPNNLLNPVAWYKFVEAWKRGDFKSKKEQARTQDPGQDK